LYDYSLIPPRFPRPVQIRDGRFELPGCDPDEPSRVLFLDAENKLGAVVEFSGKQANEPVTVRLAPCGSATAQFVDPKGQPLANYQPVLRIVMTPGVHHSLKSLEQGLLSADEEFVANLDRYYLTSPPRTDAQGRCTLPSLIPGATYRITFLDEADEKVKEFTVPAGKSVDLGDVVVERKAE
jgi:hypothetical protein